MSNLNNDGLFADTDAFEARCRAAEKEAEGYTFPDGNPVGEWVVICTNPACGKCGRNPDEMTCHVCGSPRVKTVEYLRGDDTTDAASRSSNSRVSGRDRGVETPHTAAR